MKRFLSCSTNIRNENIRGEGQVKLKNERVIYLSKNDVECTAVNPVQNQRHLELHKIKIHEKITRELLTYKKRRN